MSTSQRPTAFLQGREKWTLEFVPPQWPPTAAYSLKRQKRGGTNFFPLRSRQEAGLKLCCPQCCLHPLLLMCWPCGPWWSTLGFHPVTEDVTSPSTWPRTLMNMGITAQPLPPANLHCTEGRGDISPSQGLGVLNTNTDGEGKRRGYGGGSRA